MDNEQRLANIEAQQARTIVLLENLSKKVDDSVSSSEVWKHRIECTLHGCNGSAGLLVKLDRLEQAYDRNRWVVRALIGAVITIILGSLWTKIF